MLTADLADRFLAIQLVEACKCLDEGLSSVAEIDLAMHVGAGLSQGP